jgi:membrane-bound serine protease (ClpP class)
VTALGIALVVIGAIVITIEAHVPSLGALGGPGVVALGAGTVFAVSGLGGGVALAVVVALLLVLGAVGVLAVSLRKGLAVRQRRVSVGAEGLVGHIGVVQSWSDPGGKVLVDGALWHAQRSWGDEEALELHAGDPVVVERLNGLTLSVRRAEDWELVR